MKRLLILSALVVAAAFAASKALGRREQLVSLYRELRGGPPAPPPPPVEVEILDARRAERARRVAKDYARLRMAVGRLREKGVDVRVFDSLLERALNLAKRGEHRAALELLNKTEMTLLKERKPVIPAQPGEGATADQVIEGAPVPAPRARPAPPRRRPKPKAKPRPKPKEPAEEEAAEEDGDEGGPLQDEAR